MVYVESEMQALIRKIAEKIHSEDIEKVFPQCRHNPCRHCRNLIDNSDDSVGWVDYDCKVGMVPPRGITPCEGFIPILPSDDLLWEIADEQEKLAEVKMEKEYLGENAE